MSWRRDHASLLLIPHRRRPASTVYIARDGHDDSLQGCRSADAGGHHRVAKLNPSTGNLGGSSGLDRRPATATQCRIWARRATGLTAARTPGPAYHIQPGRALALARGQSVSRSRSCEHTPCAGDTQHEWTAPIPTGQGDHRSRGRDHAGQTCRPLSSSTTRKIHYILRGALDRAVRWRYLSVSPWRSSWLPPRRGGPSPIRRPPTGQPS
jgi:hypothetical protein